MHIKSINYNAVVGLKHILTFNSTNQRKRNHLCVLGDLNIWELNLPSPNYQCWRNTFHAPKPRKGFHGPVTHNLQKPNKITLETLFNKLNTIYKD